MKIFLRKICYSLQNKNSLTLEVGEETKLLSGTVFEIAERSVQFGMNS
jgi:hypothetical protein